MALLPLAAPSTMAATSEQTATPVPLMAGKNTQVGNVVVWNDATNLYIKYQLDAGNEWYLLETHANVYTGEAPTGNPAPGQFPYTGAYALSEYKKTVTYTVPYSDLGVSAGAALFIATHAVVATFDGQTSETAWTGGEDSCRFVNKGNWATYFPYSSTDSCPCCAWCVPGNDCSGGTGCELCECCHDDLFKELLEVNANSAASSATSTVLLSGHHYHIKVSGTWTYRPNWQPTAGIADAGFSSRGDMYQNLPPEGVWSNNMFSTYPGGMTGKDNFLELWWCQAGGTLVPFVGNAATDFNAEHVYEQELDGTDKALNFKIFDDYYGDNTGHLDVEIYEVV